MDLQKENENLKQELKAVKTDLELTKQRVEVNLHRIDNYKELLQMAVSLLTKEQYKEYEERFWQIKEKQNIKDQEIAKESLKKLDKLNEILN